MEEPKEGLARENSESGQSLILLAIFMFVFFAVLAIIVDLGFAYYQRRQAQNAADAGALAGARVYCDNPDENLDEGIAAANLYVANNNANLLPGYSDIVSGKVKVGTTITHNTYFGQLLGRDLINVRAYAEAGCYQPCLGEGVLPVVWTCNPSELGPNPGDVSCIDLPITQERLNQYLNNPGGTGVCLSQQIKGGTGYVCPELSIVMDNIDIDTLQCQSTGGLLDCDLDDDGTEDYLSSDNRGWADLDGNVDAFYACDPNSEGSVELTDWINNGYGCPFEVHTWVGDQPGNVISLYHSVEERRVTNPIVVLPVFDDNCPGDPESTCPERWHSGTHPPGDLTHEYTSTPNYYHIWTFSAFYITCVQTKKGDCPGAEKFYDDNQDLFKGGGDPLQGADYNAIEGYFLKGYIPGLKGNCGDDIDTGVFTIHLDK